MLINILDRSKEFKTACANFSDSEIEEIFNFRAELEERGLRSALEGELDKARSHRVPVPMEIYFQGSFFGFDSVKDFDECINSIRGVLDSHVINVPLHYDIFFYKTPVDADEEDGEFKMAASYEDGYFEALLDESRIVEEDDELPAFSSHYSTSYKTASGGQSDHPNFITMLILAKSFACEMLSLNPNNYPIYIQMVTKNAIGI